MKIIKGPKQRSNQICIYVVNGNYDIANTINDFYLHFNDAYVLSHIFCNAQSTLSGVLNDHVDLPPFIITAPDV